MHKPINCNTECPKKMSPQKKLFCLEMSAFDLWEFTCYCTDKKLSGRTEYMNKHPPIIVIFMPLLISNKQNFLLVNSSCLRY